MQQWNAKDIRLFQFYNFEQTHSKMRFLMQNRLTFLPANTNLLAEMLFVSLDKLSKTLCPNSVQFHYILQQFNIQLEQESNDNFIITLLTQQEDNNRGGGGF